MRRYLAYNLKRNKISGIFFLNDEIALRKFHKIKGINYILPSDSLFLLESRGIYKMDIINEYPYLLNLQTGEKYNLSLIVSRLNGKYCIPENIPYQNYLYTQNFKNQDGNSGTLFIIGKGKETCYKENHCLKIDDHFEIMLPAGTCVRYVDMNMFVKIVNHIQGVAVVERQPVSA